MSDTANDRPVTYALWWDPGTRRPDQIMTVDEARQRDAQGLHYSVILGDPEHPAVVMDVQWQEKLLFTYFLDQWSRLWLKLEFQRTGEQTMFLTHITQFSYPSTGYAPADDASRIDRWEYLPNGHGRRHLWEADKEMLVADFDEADIGGCWEPVPTFGEWESVTRTDRTQNRWTPPTPGSHPDARA
ncbi:hypothetical protein ACWDNI_10335 [Nocardia niigatensis]